MMPARKPTPEIPEAFEALAADWLARRDAGLDAVETAQLLEWLADDPRHAAAFEQVATAWKVFDQPRARGLADGILRGLEARQRRRRRAVGVTAVTLTLATAALCTVVLRPAWIGLAPQATQPADRVVVVRPTHRILADGSVVELNQGAQIDVTYSPGRRDIRLLRGDAHFTVAKDPARPFIVTTPKTSVRAVGTVFAVSVQAEAVDLLVTEGKVAVGRPDPATTDKPVLVAAGNRLFVPTAASGVPAPEPVTPEEVERRLAWRAPRLELSGTPLRDVVVAFNRNNRTQLSISDPSLAALKLSGVFRADRVEDFVRLLQAHYGVRATPKGATEIVLNRE